jgi:integral membrane protein (TIGR01906 family)
VSERIAREEPLVVARRIAALLFIIALPVALLTTNIRLAANEPRVYEYAADQYDTPERTGLPRSEVLRASAELRAYFNNDEATVAIRARTADGDLTALFSAREIAHLRDVKDLFQMTFRVQEVAVAFVLAYIVLVFIWAREGPPRALAREVAVSGLLGLAVLGVVAGIALAGFDAAFERFHLIAFDNDLWRLDPARDRLIQMFPEAFWRDVTLWVGAATLAELALLAAGAALYLGVTREPSERVSVPSGVRAEA